MRCPLKTTPAGRPALHSLCRRRQRKTEPQCTAERMIMKTPSNQNTNLKPAGFRSARHLGKGRVWVDFRKRHENRALSTDRVLDMLRLEAPRFFELAAVVGQWIWIAFDQKQPGKTTALLSQFGFHWSRRRQCWQHPCGRFVDGPSSRDPRETYGCYFPARTANTLNR